MSDWRLQANCAGLPDTVFFNEDDYPAAISICGRCEVQAQCLEYAFQQRETIEHGIYGGTTPEERASYLKDRGARLPKYDPDKVAKHTAAYIQELIASSNTGEDVL